MNSKIEGLLGSEAEGILKADGKCVERLHMIQKLRASEKIKLTRIAQDFFRIQGVPAEAYFTYSSVETMKNSDEKTSKTVHFIFSEALNWKEKLHYH